MAKEIKQDDRELQTIIVPWRENCSLLLPNEVVAEVIYHLEVMPTENKNNWIQGEVEWQGLSLPLISFDAVVDLPDKVDDERRRVLICRSLSFSEQYPFFAIDFYRLPRHLVVRESDLYILETENDSEIWPFVAKVNVHEADAYILDIEKLCSFL